ncbi:MAG TPA: NAD-dependent epimerase/dehydratase family protein [Vicinamibacterales bacterium]|jgi:nucleoside-diphosphate-sugar epimerase
MSDFPRCNTVVDDGPDGQVSVAGLAAIESTARLEEVLSRPSPADVACLRRIDGDVAILGAGGKMGPSLARRVRRASAAAGVSRRVIAVSISWEPGVRESLSRDGIETLTCDFLDLAALARLPLCPNVLYLVGRKFGTAGSSDLTWAVNTLAPAYMADRFSDSRLVLFSSGNVYGMVPVEGDGSVETDLPVPVGEYAQSCLGRERVAEYFSRTRGTRCLLFRLNYAVDLRYGVLVDVGRRVFEGQGIDLRVGYANVIWQGDALSYALRSLELAMAPPRALNVTGPELVRIRDLALWFGGRFGREPRFEGEEGPTALLSNAGACYAALGQPEVGLDCLREWAASWIESGGPRLDKPTKYEVVDGRY